MVTGRGVWLHPLHGDGDAQCWCKAVLASEPKSCWLLTPHICQLRGVKQGIWTISWMVMDDTDISIHCFGCLHQLLSAILVSQSYLSAQGFFSCLIPIFSLLFHGLLWFCPAVKLNTSSTTTSIYQKKAFFSENPKVGNLKPEKALDQSYLMCHRLAGDAAFIYTRIRERKQPRPDCPFISAPRFSCFDELCEHPRLNL